MKAGGGKAKGGGFERLVCKALSRWLSRGMRDDLFWRSAMSGGRASVQFKRGRKNQTQVCDISAIHPQGDRLMQVAVVECKFIKNLHFASLLVPYVDGKSARGTIAEYWWEVCRLAAKAGRHPILIAKQNGVMPFVLLDVDGCDKFHMSNELEAASFRLNDATLFPFEVFLREAARP